MRQLILRFVVLSLVFLTLSRLALMAWQWPRIVEGGGWWPLLRGGWRIDTSLIALICLMPALFAPWLGHRRWPTLLSGVWLRLWWCVLVLLEVSTPQFVLEYDLRPNRLYVEYLSSPREVAAMLWQGYRMVLVTGSAALVLLVWGGWRCLPLRPDRQPLRLRWRPLASLALTALLFLAARGTLAHRPINPAMVAFSPDLLVNTLALNSTYSVAYALYQMGNERPLSYGSMEEGEMQRIMREAAAAEGAVLDPEQPLQRRVMSSVDRARPLNIVIIIEESLGAQYVGALGGRGLTPRLDALMAQGWALTNLYATGTRSVRGLEAIVTGFPPTPAQAVLKLSRAQQNFFTLADLLDDFGYESRFIYGGEAHFDNMRGFFLANGFQDIHDVSEFHQPDFVGSWGAADEDMFDELHRLLQAGGKAPSFTVAFTVSNHSPWEYPAGRIEPVGEAASVDNAVRYADWALGQFFDRAKGSAYWSNTLFLIVADHDSRVYGAEQVPVERFHVPALFLGADVQPRLDNRLVSQIDLAPTLVSLAGLDAEHPMVGVDLARHSPDRALMQYDNNFGFLQGDSLMVLAPQRAPAQFQYRRGQVLAAQAVDNDLARKALAHTLWPVWAYLHQRYRDPD